MRESLAYPLSLSVIQAYLEATYQMWSGDQEAYPIYIIGDSQSALSALQGTSKEMLLRSVFGKVNDEAISILIRFPKVQLKFIWLPAEYNISGYKSKIHPNLVKIVNSDRWIFGNKKFEDQKFLKKNVFGHFSRDTLMFELLKDFQHTQGS